MQAKDAAGNTDQSPAVRTWTIASAPSVLFSDGFESGTLAPNWQVVTGGNGTATAQTATVKTGTITADFNVTQEGASRATSRCCACSIRPAPVS
ncbi:MAG TPA: hypothetical protein VNA28_02155 [Solirubrobacteraceae bacterium]|nr:hypothetical protein [Solirubrobacteraceae bacterium]